MDSFYSLRTVWKPDLKVRLQKQGQIGVVEKHHFENVLTLEGGSMMRKYIQIYYSVISVCKQLLQTSLFPILPSSNGIHKYIRCHKLKSLSTKVMHCILLFTKTAKNVNFGGLAQMVERSVCIREVQGSMPWSSKMKPHVVFVSF